jgi:hypothetical protein
VIRARSAISIGRPWKKQDLFDSIPSINYFLFNGDVPFFIQSLEDALSFPNAGKLLLSETSSKSNFSILL